MITLYSPYLILCKKARGIKPKLNAEGLLKPNDSVLVVSSCFCVPNSQVLRIKSYTTTGQSTNSASNQNAKQEENGWREAESDSMENVLLRNEVNDVSDNDWRNGGDMGILLRYVLERGVEVALLFKRDHLVEVGVVDVCVDPEQAWMAVDRGKGGRGRGGHVPPTFDQP